jgi:hypothetical protein
METPTRGSLAVVASLSLLIACQALADGASKPKLDTASKTALRETQQMMVNPAMRQKALEADPQAKAVDSQARAAVGDQNTAAVYDLAADIMGSLTEEAGGDPAKMLELLQQAQQNPEALIRKMTPEQRAKLKALSGRIPAAEQKKQGSPSP